MLQKVHISYFDDLQKVGFSVIFWKIFAF